MGERSSSGVRNIRAMFEAKADDTSPPSRGRSPANSELSGAGSRPISTVRTSFVPVDRSGQQGGLFGARKPSDTWSGGARTPSLSAESRLDGSAVVDTPMSLANVKEEETSYMKAREGTEAATGKAGYRKANGDMSYSDPAVDLGTVLKGSPFESGSPQKPRDILARVGGTLKPTNSPVRPSSVREAAKAFGQGLVGMKSPNDTKPVAPRPSAISTKATYKVGPGPQSAKSTKSDKALKTPTTPKSATAAKGSSRHSSAAVASPKQPNGAKEAGKGAAPAQAPVRKTSRMSLAPENKGKSSLTAPTATSAAKASAPAKTANSTPASSKKPGTVKPGPKSPTKPTKLPAAATASTAASSAKLGTGSRSPSRASSVATDRRVSAASRSGLRQSGVGIKTKASRASLAPGDQHASGSSAKGASEGFLERMMRPTQASASKAHEKIEVKSPPRGNRVVSKPKRPSGVIPKEKEDKSGEENQAEGPTETTEAPELGTSAAADSNAEAPAQEEITPSEPTLPEPQINGDDALELTPDEPEKTAPVAPAGDEQPAATPTAEGTVKPEPVNA